MGPQSAVECLPRRVMTLQWVLKKVRSAHARPVPLLSFLGGRPQNRECAMSEAIDLRKSYVPLTEDGDIKRGNRAKGWRLGHEQSTVEWWKEIKENGKEVAIKFTKEITTEQKNLNRQCDRSRLCSFNAAPNLVLIQAKVCDTTLNRYGLVFDYIAGVETLAKKMEQPGSKFEEDVARNIFREIMRAVEPMHRTESTPSVSILHRRLTPENVLVTADRKKAYVINWSNSTKDRDTSAHGLIDACDYTAPEFTRKETGNTAKNLDQKVDVWSCGVILYRMVCGRLPFSGTENLTMRDLAERITNADFEFPRGIRITPPCQELIESMITKKPGDRITSKGALTHEWVTAGKRQREEQTYDELRTPDVPQPNFSVPADSVLQDDEGGYTSGGEVMVNPKESWWQRAFDDDFQPQ